MPTPPPPVFFFSYARDDAGDGPALGKFYKELVGEVRSKTGAKPEQITFTDVESMPLGTRWSKQLATGLQKAETFVFLSSPSSHASDWCGKEWAYFESRVERYRKVRSLPEPPPVMIPVVWVPDPNIPPAVQKLELSNRSTLVDVYLKQGLRKLRALEPASYKRVLHALAAAIDQAHRQYHFPAGKDQPDFDTLVSPFPKSSAGRPPALFVFLVGERKELSKSGHPHLKTAYGNDDPPTWRPFCPTEDTTAQDAAYNAAIAEEFEYVVHPVESVDLDRLAVADRDGAAIFLVDPWSLTISNWGDRLKRCQAAKPPRAWVVPWNRTAAGATRRELEERLQAALVSPNRHTVGSADKLQALLQRELIRCRQELLENAPEVANGQEVRPIPGLSAVRDD